MKVKVSGLFVLLLIILGSMVASSVEAVTSQKLTDSYTLDPAEATTQEYQRKTFYGAGRFWAFYNDGYQIVYRSSTDGTTWDSPIAVTRMGVATTTTPMNVTFGQCFSLFYNGTVLAYATGATHSAEIYGGTPGGYYRMGTPQTDGSITWASTEKEYTVSAPFDRAWKPSITIDDEGYVWITADKQYYDSVAYPDNEGTPWITKNTKKDGTWTTAPGFPIQLDSRNSNDRGWNTLITRMPGGRVYVIYSIANSTYDADFLTHYGKYFDSDGTVLATENVKTTGWDWTGFTRSAVEVDGVIYYVWRERQVGNTTTRIIYQKRSTSGSWSSPANITGYVDYDMGGPTISTTSDERNLYVVYVVKNGANWDAKYKTMLISSGAWLGPYDIETGITGTASPIGVSSDYEGDFFSTIYTKQASSAPYEARHFFNYPDLLPQIVSVEVSNLDDTTNAYSMYKYYHYDVTVSSGLSGNLTSDITKIGLKVVQGSTTLFTVKVIDLDTTPFWSLISGTANLALNTTSCTWNSGTGVASFYIKTTMACPTASVDTLYAWAYGSYSDNSTWGLGSQFYIINRMVTTGPYSSNVYVPNGSNVTISGTISYASTQTGNGQTTAYPPASELTGIKIKDQYGVVWGSDTSLPSGAYSVTFNTTNAPTSSDFYVYLDLATGTSSLTPDGRYVTVGLQTFYAPILLATIANLLGISDFATPLTNALTSLGGYFSTALGNGISVLIQMATIVALFATSVIFWLTLVVSTVVSVITTVGNLLNGTYSATTYLGNIWTLIGFGTWAPLLVLILLITWWDSLTPRARREGKSVYYLMIGDVQAGMYIVELIYTWSMYVFNFIYSVVTWMADVFLKVL